MPVKLKKLFSDPLSIVLVVVIVLALVFAGLLGGELYARNRADSVVAKVVQCVVQDDATASFGALPPFLLQHVSGHYTNIHIETAGNQVRDAKGMKLNLDINDVRAGGHRHLERLARLPGRRHHLDHRGHQGDDPGRDPAGRQLRHRGDDQCRRRHDRTRRARWAASPPSPEVVDGGISLQVQQVTGLGFTLPRETVQPALDAFTSKLTQELSDGHPRRFRSGHRFRCGEPILDHATQSMPEADRRPLLRRDLSVSPARRAPRGCRTGPAGSRPRRASPTASAAVRIPPLALTPSRPPTVSAISSTARADAPPLG